MGGSLRQASTRAGPPGSTAGNNEPPRKKVGTGQLPERMVSQSLEGTG